MVVVETQEVNIGNDVTRHVGNAYQRNPRRREENKSIARLLYKRTNEHIHDTETCQRIR
jgi:hypothetical protein